jgi:hypothetical protein
MCLLEEARMTRVVRGGGRAWMRDIAGAREASQASAGYKKGVRVAFFRVSVC